MKIFLLTDLHLHEWPTHGSYTAEGIHTRLQDGVNILNQVSSYMERARIATGFFLGDINHMHDRMLYSVQVELVQWVRKEKEAGRTWYWLIGNHDVDTFTGKYHCLECIRDYVYLIEQPQVLYLGGVRFFWVPWQSDGKHFVQLIQDFRKSCTSDKPVVLCIHHDIADIPYRGSYIGRSGSCKDLASFSLVLSGHYHDMILRPPIYYLGSPMQFDWGDAGTDRGAWVLSTKTLRLSRVPLHAPRFVKVQDTVLTSWSSAKLRKAFWGNFVRIVVTQPQTTSLKDHYMQLLPKSVEFVEIQGSLSDQDNVVLETSDSLISWTPESVKEFITQYVQHTAPSGYSRKKLVSIGTRIVQQLLING